MNGRRVAVELDYLVSPIGERQPDDLPVVVLPAGATEQDSEFVRRWLDLARSDDVTILLRKPLHPKPSAFDMLRHQIKQNQP